MDKFLKRYLLIIGITLSVFSIHTSASTIVIDFGTGLAGSGGSIADNGSHIVGTNINIGSLEAVDTSADAVYEVDALLNFDTEDNIITIVGKVAGLGITRRKV